MPCRCTPMVRHFASCTRASLAGSSLGIWDVSLPILSDLGYGTSELPSSLSSPSAADAAGGDGTSGFRVNSAASAWMRKIDIVVMNLNDACV